MDNRKKSKRRMERLIGKIFILCLFGVMLVNIIIPDREMSEEENRMLASKPKLTFSTLVNGDFMEQYEEYLSDQFAGRDLWHRMKVALDRFGGSRMENGIYIGKDGQLLQDIQVPVQEHLSENLDAIKEFTETYQDIPVTMILVPDAACKIGRAHV